MTNTAVACVEGSVLRLFASREKGTYGNSTGVYDEKKRSPQRRRANTYHYFPIEVGASRRGETPKQASS